MPISSLGFDLDRGERELWAGAPRPGVVLRASDTFMIPFSLLWGGFAAFWEYMVFRQGAPLMFKIWGVPFVLVGLYITVGRFFTDALRRAQTTYLVTSGRVMINSGLLSRTTKSLNLRTLTDVTLNEHRDGTGTITFGPQIVSRALYQGMAWPGMQLTPAFEMIPDAAKVYDTIRKAQEQAGQAAG